MLTISGDPGALSLLAAVWIVVAVFVAALKK